MQTKTFIIRNYYLLERSIIIAGKLKSLNIVTCHRRTQFVEAHNRHIFVVYTIVLSPFTVLTICKRRFSTKTFDIVQQNLSSSRTEDIASVHAKIPESKNAAS